jgi:hypothetical protein
LLDASTDGNSERPVFCSEELESELLAALETEDVAQEDMPKLNEPAIKISKNGIANRFLFITLSLEVLLKTH